MARVRPKAQPRLSGGMWLAILGIVVAAVVSSWLYLEHRSKAQAIDDTTLCFKRVQPPVSELIMVDVTDHIVPANVTMIEEFVAQEARRLPRASRVVVVTFGDDTSSAFVPVYTRCTAASGDAARIDENARMLDASQESFASDLRTKLRTAIASAPDSHTSPITQQVVRAASSTTLGWDGGKRKLILITDGLETGSLQGRRVRLEPAPDRLLEGVETTFVEVGNRRDSRLQSSKVREAWKEWFENAGASSTTMVAPGFARSGR